VAHTTKKRPPLIDEKSDQSYDWQCHGSDRLRRKGVGACNSTEAIVRVDGLSKTYGRVHALEDVGFSIRAGEILGLIGPRRSWLHLLANPSKRAYTSLQIV
jgi:ABC-type glutathione transport system ATPase component